MRTKILVLILILILCSVCLAETLHVLRNDVPVYRFWSPTLEGHFYTADEAEKQKLIDDYPHVWTYECIAFYAKKGVAP